MLLNHAREKHLQNNHEFVDPEKYEKYFVQFYKFRVMGDVFINLVTYL